MSEQPTTPATIETASVLRSEAADLMAIDSTTLDHPQRGHIRFRGRFMCDLSNCYDELRRRFERHGFTPIVREEEGQVVLFAVPIVFNPPASNWVINLILLVATIVSTFLVGALHVVDAADLGVLDTYLLALKQLWLGWPYGLSLMLILGAHELGHYFAARYHKVPVTLPYFLPLPYPPLIGTLGAFIRLKAPVKNKRALFDVGAAGPLAGLIFAVPILIIGLMTSDVGPLPEDGYLLEGNSLLYLLLKWVIHGRILPDFANNVDVSLNQVAWAGWVGLLVTGLNLIPVGQLDGGHVVYVLFGKRARKLFWPVLIVLAGLVIMTGTFTWVIWMMLIYLMGRVYAEPLDDVTPIKGWRRNVAIITLGIFILVFVPIPLRLMV